MERYGKLARLYTAQDLAQGVAAALTEEQTHYLKNVLRKKPGDALRVFNGRDGEFLAALEAAGKKILSARVQKKIREQPERLRETRLLFAPIKKSRMNFLIEKAVELGVTRFHPVITAHTENRSLNETRLRAQVIEAAEQCERMDIPQLHAPEPLKTKISAWDKSVNILWCYERSIKSPSLKEEAGNGNYAFLIGPEGGFDDDEAAFLSRHSFVRPVSLGDSILRAETAALSCLAWAKLINST